MAMNCGQNRRPWEFLENDVNCTKIASAAGLDDLETSTVAESEVDETSMKQRWADLADSEDDDDGVLALARVEVSKLRWADLSDDDDQIPEPHATEARDSKTSNEMQHVETRKPRWADVVDSDDEGALIPLAVHPLISANCSATPAGSGPTIVTQAAKGVGKGPKTSESRMGSAKDARKQVKDALKSATGKAAGKGKRRSSKGSGKGSSDKLQCQFIIGIDEDEKFGVVRRILGRAGANMKSIAERTGVKLRLRGRGSKFLEGPEQRESADELMLCVSGQDKDGFELAKELVSEILQDIYKQHASFCFKAGKASPTLTVQVHHGYRAGSR